MLFCWKIDCLHVFWIWQPRVKKFNWLSMSQIKCQKKGAQHIMQIRTNSCSCSQLQVTPIQLLLMSHCKIGVFFKKKKKQPLVKHYRIQVIDFLQPTWQSCFDHLQKIFFVKRELADIYGWGFSSSVLFLDPETLTWH